LPRKFATDEERRTYERERARKRRQAETPDQREKRLAQGKNWYAANKKEKQQANKAWKQANSDRNRELDRNSYHANVEERRLSARIYQSHKRADKNSAFGSYTSEEADWLYDSQHGLCYYCGVRLVDYHIDHMLPLTRGGTNFLENLCCACPECNISKGQMTSSEYREYLWR